MKKIIYSLFLNLLLIATAYGQAGNISFHATMTAGSLQTWTIDVKEAKAVRISYAIDVVLNSDNVTFYDINTSGTTNSPTFYPSGYCSGTYITATKTGKAQITLYCYTSGMKNIDIQYCADNSIVTSSDLNIGGNSFITGRLGVGNSTTTKKVEFWDASTSRFTFSGTGCTSGYEIANTIDNTGYKINVGSSIRNFKVAINSVDKLTVGTDGTIDLAGTVMAGTTNKIKLMDWTNQGSWIDIPVVTGKASGIGSGGVGANAWVAYAGLAQQWFTNSSAGDICYRNIGGKLLFGNTDGNAVMAISANKVGIGTTTSNAMLTVNGSIYAKEVVVTVDIPADYVFKPTYKLMPLHEVEQYVNANSHLPEIPSASEITEKGLSVGEMQNKLLQKVEELTLYIIEQQKQINQLKQGLK
jgi:hypothetical protein